MAGSWYKTAGGKGTTGGYILVVVTFRVRRGNGEAEVEADAEVEAEAEAEEEGCKAEGMVEVGGECKYVACGSPKYLGGRALTVAGPEISVQDQADAGRTGGRSRRGRLLASPWLYTYSSARPLCSAAD